VNPGDIIFGDADGVVVIPKAAVENITPKAIHAKQKDEEKVREAKEGQLERIFSPGDVARGKKIFPPP